MNLLKKIFTPTRGTGSRFNRYYGRVAHSGAGYPTADEARKDFANRTRQTHPFGWPM